MTLAAIPQAPGCFLRPAQFEDELFLFTLFAESQQQLAFLQSDERLWQSLVEMQHRGRELSYAASFPEASDSILCLDEGSDARTPVGRVLVNRGQQSWRIVDIAVLNQHRGKGLGTRVLRECQAQCRQAGATLELEVAPQNPAMRLYKRLGFRITGEDVLAIRMAWNAED
jgi:ribosomal protein S18 acetylase RimI-like enzyme